MKKLTILTALLLSAFTMKSQIWFDLGVKGGFTPGLSINSNVFNDKNYTLKFASGYQYGGKIGINFDSEHAIAIEGLLSTINTKTTVGDNDASTLSLQYLEIPILYRFNKEDGGYTEIGPVISLLQGAEREGTDFKSQFVDNNYGLMIGLGQYIGGGNLFGLNLGFRMSYTFNDIVNGDNQTLLGNAVYTPSDLESLGSFEYKATHNLYAGIVLEFNFNLGYIVKGSGCHKNSRFKLF